MHQTGICIYSSHTLYTILPSKDNEAAVKLELQDVGRVPMNAPKIAGCSGNSPYTFASCNETKTSKAKHIEVSLAEL